MTLRLRLAWALLAGLAPPASAQDAPPAWAGAFDFLVQSVCADPHDLPQPGVTPLDGPAACPRPRKLRIGERLPYHKRDWPGTADRAARPDGYQQSDSYPVRSTLGTAVVQTYDFGDEPRAFGRFDDGDGGQVAFFSDAAASFGLTEDGGAGLQLFLGPACAPEDGWVIVDRSFPAQPAGQTLARLTRDAGRCPGRLGYAFTRWHVETLSFRERSRSRIGRVALTSLVSEHFGGKDAAGADHLERSYFTRELGYTRWERWQNLSVHDRARDRRQAEELAASDRCEPELGAPADGGAWVMVDCREWTEMAPPSDPAGDPPDFWLDRLRGYDATRTIFPTQ